MTRNPDDLRLICDKCGFTVLEDECPSEAPPPWPPGRHDSPLIEIERDNEGRRWVQISCAARRCGELRQLRGCARLYHVKLYIAVADGKRSLCRIAEWAGFRRWRMMGNRGQVYVSR